MGAKVNEKTKKALYFVLYYYYCRGSLLATVKNLYYLPFCLYFLSSIENSNLFLKKKMEKMGGRISATLILAFLFISSAHSFYLPGVAPRDFQKVRLSAFLFLIH